MSRLILLPVPRPLSYFQMLCICTFSQLNRACSKTLLSLQLVCSAYRDWLLLEIAKIGFYTGEMSSSISPAEQVQFFSEGLRRSNAIFLMDSDGVSAIILKWPQRGECKFLKKHPVELCNFFKGLRWSNAFFKDWQSKCKFLKRTPVKQMHFSKKRLWWSNAY